MNRTLLFGIAIFFAVVGIALIGGENKAMAGRHHHGCYACDGGCGGAPACCGCHGHRRCFGLFHRHRCGGCHGCCGGAPACCGGCCGGAPACDGGAPAPAPAPAPAAAPAGEAAPPPAPAPSASRTPFGFRQVSYRR